MRRDELAEAVWGETPPASWDKALSVVISKLRGVLAEGGHDPDALTGAFGCYRLELPEGAWVDVLAAADATGEAEDALAANQPERAKPAAMLAASLLREPFLPGEDGAWVEAKRRDFDDSCVDARSWRWRTPVSRRTKRRRPWGGPSRRSSSHLSARAATAG